jgi:hypothetical protein
VSINSEPGEAGLSALTTARMRQIFEGVWRDRAFILGGRGSLSGEDALAGAAYWRLCKAGREPGDCTEDFEPFLIDILRQYRAEALDSSLRVGPAG